MMVIYTRFKFSIYMKYTQEIEECVCPAAADICDWLCNVYLFADGTCVMEISLSIQKDHTAWQQGGFS